jgi:hypothetical protein
MSLIDTINRRNHRVYLFINNYDDYVDADETLSLNCGHQWAYCSSPQLIYEHGKPWWNDLERGKLLIHPPELSGNATS